MHSRKPVGLFLCFFLRLPPFLFPKLQWNTQIYSTMEPNGQWVMELKPTLFWLKWAKNNPLVGFLNTDGRMRSTRRDFLTLLITRQSVWHKVKDFEFKRVRVKLNEFCFSRIRVRSSLNCLFYLLNRYSKDLGN